MITIIGATGNTGRIAAEKLLASGKKVRVVGRSAAHLEPLVKKGAEAFVGDVTDEAMVTKAFAGAEAAYLLIPPNLSAPDVRAHQAKAADAQVRALEKSGLEFAVFLSSVGADKPDKTGPVVGLRHFEERLNGISRLNALYLRAGYFMENFLAQPGVIRQLGMMAGPLKPDLPLPMIAAQDIGAYAAERLAKRDFQGKRAAELLGQRDLDYREATKITGKAIGKPSLAYSQLPSAMLKMALTSMGMSSNMADLLLEMSDSLNSGYMKPLEARTAANTTPTSFEQFVTEKFVPAYSGKGAAV